MSNAGTTDGKGSDGVARPKNLSELPQGQWWDHLNTEVVEFLKAKGFSRHVNRSYRPPPQPEAPSSERQTPTKPVAPAPLSLTATPDQVAAYNAIRSAYDSDVATWLAEVKRNSDEDAKYQRALDAFDKYDAEAGKALGILGGFYEKTQWDSVKRHEVFVQNRSVIGALDASEALFQGNTQSGNR